MDAIHLAQPWLLSGALAAAVPFLLHWLARPAPKRVRFPPVALLTGALYTGRRAHRLRNFWLLLLRALTLAVAALLLAGPTCYDPAAELDADVGGATRPQACMILLDESWSTNYQLVSGRRCDELLAEAAIELVRQAPSWAQPSDLGLVFSGSSRPEIRPTDDFAAIRAALRVPPPHASDARPLGTALRRAAELLGEARQPLRRIVVFTDGAAHAWRDVSPSLLAGAGDVVVDVVLAGTEARTNLALTAVQADPGPHPETAPIALHAQVACAGVPSVVTVALLAGLRLLAESDPIQLDADQTRTVTVLAPPLPAGLHALRAEIRPADRLLYDQVRFTAVQTTPPPRVWLVAPRAEPHADLAAQIVQNLLAPAALDATLQRVRLTRLAPEDLNRAASRSRVVAERNAPEQDDPRLVVLISGCELSDAARQLLAAQVERGGTLLLIPGSDPAQWDWPGVRAWLAARPPRPEQPDALTTITWSDTTSPARANSGAAEISACGVRIRLALDGLLPAAAVEGVFSDGRPAVVSRTRGRGRVYLLATSPDPRYSELGIRAAGLLSWLHALVGTASGPPRVLETSVGEPVPPGMWSQSAEPPRLRRIEPPENAARSVHAAASDGSVHVSAPGVYAVGAAARSAQPPPQPPPDGVAADAVLLVANWPAEESDFTPIDEAELRARLGRQAVRLRVFDPQVRGTSVFGDRRKSRFEAADSFAVLLLALLLAEAVFSNRGPARAAADRCR